MHAHGVVDPYEFKNDTVRGVEYYKLLDIFVRSEAHQLPPNVDFLQGGALPHIIRSVNSLFEKRFPIHGMEDMVQ